MVFVAQFNGKIIALIDKAAGLCQRLFPSSASAFGTVPEVVAKLRRQPLYKGVGMVLFNIVHGFTPEQNTALLGRASAA